MTHRYEDAFWPIFSVKDDRYAADDLIVFDRETAIQIAMVWGPGTIISLKSKYSGYFWAAGQIRRKADDGLCLDVGLMTDVL